MAYKRGMVHKNVRPITPRQAEALAFLTAFQKTHGYPPTMSEMAAHFDMAKTNSWRLLTALERAGRIRRQKGSARAISLLTPAAAA
jgi:repressor LexA